MGRRRQPVPLQFPDWAQMTAERRAHAEGVASLLSQWAAAIQVSEGERARWLRAAVLHDALKDAPAEVLQELAPHAWGIAELRHGPAAAEMARRHGERDEGVLEAVRYHSVGYASWEVVGRMLYLADYLEPGRSRHPEESTRLAAAVPSDPDAVLREVAGRRVAHLVRKQRQLIPETVDFWNRVVSGSRSRD